jgi:hypothetical protein
MNRAICSALGVATGLLCHSALAPAEEMPSQEEMWRIIKQQQREIDELKRTQKTTDEKAEAAVEAAEQSRQGATAAASWADKTQIGGYGELHYKNLDTDDGRDKEIDFTRFVLFFGHQFTDRLRFWSELELEHAIAGDDQNGEIELEQAYVEYDITPSQHVKGGMFLIPVGILNETHEPVTFYGVRRNPVERNIIPTTWWAGGAELVGEIAPGWSYNFGIHEGLDTDDYNIRDGRQKTSEADAHDLASTGRIKWNGIPGVELAATVQYQQNITQGEDNDASAWLYEAHADVRRGPLGLRALYARWDIDGDGAKALGRDEQDGFYVEPSYRINPEFGLFVRYSQWDNEAGSSSDSEKRQYNGGVNYWPHPDVVLKADYQYQDNQGDVDEEKGINLGVGYQF